MNRREEFESADIGDRLVLLSSVGACVLEHHTAQRSTLYYSVGDFFVEISFDGPDHHPCMSMTAFTTTDPLCDHLLRLLDQESTGTDYRQPE